MKNCQTEYAHSASELFLVYIMLQIAFTYLTPKPWGEKLGFLFWFTAYLQYSSHILIQFRSTVTWLAFEEEAKILICFSLRKKKIFEIYSGQKPGNGERIYTVILKGVEHELN